MRASSNSYIFLVLCAILISLMWSYYMRYHQITEDLLTARGFPQRTFSDLYPSWLGSRELLLRGCDPYSAAITQKIQEGYYGRAITGSPQDPIDQQRFAYPAFIVFLLAPSILLPFEVVKILATILLLGAAILTVAIWTRLMGLDLRLRGEVALILVCLSTIPYAEGIQLQQLSVFVAFVMAASVYALAKERLVIGGVFLAISTIKPQMSIPFVAYIMVWGISNWKERRRVVISLLLTVATLILASEMLLPHWQYEFVACLKPYLRYTQATSGVRALLGPTGAIFSYIVSGVIVVVAVWQARFAPANSRQFTTVAVLVLVFTSLVLPSLAPHIQALVMPAYLLLVKEGRMIWKMGAFPRALLRASWLVVIWPWVTGSILAMAFVISQDRGLLRHWDLPLYTNPLIPAVVFCSLCPLLAQTLLRNSARVYAAG